MSGGSSVIHKTDLVLNVMGYLSKEYGIDIDHVLAVWTKKISDRVVTTPSLCEVEIGDELYEDLFDSEEADEDEESF